MLYITIGTGIGVGAIVNGAILHGRSHPEMGHMRIPQDQDDCQPDSPGQLWRGNCVIHGNCWEGLASGPARAKRTELWKRAGAPGPDDVLLESGYIAVGLSDLISIFRPKHVVLGGGVLHDEALLPEFRDRVREFLDVGYFPEASQVEELVVPPGLGDAAGVVGAILLAAQRAARASAAPLSAPRLSEHIETGLAQL